MAECFVYGQSSNTEDMEKIFDYTNITHYYDLSSLDLTNLQWNDTIGDANIILNGGSVDDNALKLGVNEWGEVVCDEPDTIYIVYKKPVSGDTECIIGRGTETVTSTAKRDMTLYSYTSPSCRLSASGSPYIDADIDLTKYCIVAMVRMNNINTDGTNAIMLFIDGILYGYITDTNKIDYIGFITLNRHCIGENNYNAYATENLYVKNIVFGGTQTVEQIVNNSKYLLQKYGD